MFCPIRRNIISLHKPLYATSNSLTRVNHLNILFADNLLNKRSEKWIVRTSQNYLIDTLVQEWLDNSTHRNLSLHATLQALLNKFYKAIAYNLYNLNIRSITQNFAFYLLASCALNTANTVPFCININIS